MSPLVKYVFRNLGTRPFVSLLVFFAMLVVGATLGGVAAIGAGLVSAFQSGGGHDNWVLVSSRGAAIEQDSELAVTDLNALTVDPAVKRSSPEVVTMSMVIEGDTVEVVVLRGLEPQGFDMHGVKLLDGRMPAPQAHEVIVGKALLQHWPWLKIGATVKLLNEDFTCVGVFDAPGFLDGELMTSRATYLANPRWFQLSVIYLETESKAAAVALGNKLSENRAVKVKAVPEPAFYEKVVREFSFLIDGITMIFVLVVSGAVLVATSLLTVFQQRRLSELSVMRAVGFRSRAIAMLIVYETELLVLSGGAAGIAAASFALRNYVVATMAPSMATIVYTAQLRPPLALAAVGVMFVIGLLGAVWPIVRMVRTPIYRGLREE